jgi:hypothetical protein
MSLKNAVPAVSAVAMIAAMALAPVAASAPKHHTAHHAKKHARKHRARAAGSDVNCSGVQSTNVSGNLTVPSGKTCTINHGVKIGGDVIVNSAATLIDKGAAVGGNVTGSSPKGIGIGGSGSIGGDVALSGVSGTGPGTVTAGSNYICATSIKGNLTVQTSTSKAGPWIIGDLDEGCSSGGNQVGGDVYVANNNNRVDVANNEQGTFPYTVGITGNLTVQGNAASLVVESNFVAGDATCQAGTTKDADGTPNTVDGNNSGCH